MMPLGALPPALPPGGLGDPRSHGRWWDSWQVRVGSDTRAAPGQWDHNGWGPPRPTWRGAEARGPQTALSPPAGGVRWGFCSPCPVQHWVGFGGEALFPCQPPCCALGCGLLLRSNRNGSESHQGMLPPLGPVLGVYAAARPPAPKLLVLGKPTPPPPNSSSLLPRGQRAPGPAWTQAPMAPRQEQAGETLGQVRGWGWVWCWAQCSSPRAGSGAGQGQRLRLGQGWCRSQWAPPRSPVPPLLSAVTVSPSR